MFPFCSFLSSICRLVKAMFTPVFYVTRRMYRNAAVLMTGTAVVAVMTFTSAGFAGGGHNALTVYADMPTEEAETGEEDRDEEIAKRTEAKLQLRLTSSESLNSGQQLLGDTLAQRVQEDDRIRQARMAAVEETKQEIKRVEEERARIRAEEEARRAAEEARKAAAKIEYSQEDYDLLLRIVEAEAGICDMKGRILVANVIINRVESDEFPDNITDVVYQKSQFSPVTDGRLYTCRVTGETVEAVDRALAGEDYSQGALYFMNRGRSQSKNVSWFDGQLTYLFDHDRHEFFR